MSLMNNAIYLNIYFLLFSSLYKDEQAITARRVTAILASVIEYAANVQLVSKLIDENSKSTSETEANRNILENICRICTLLDNTVRLTLFFIISLVIYKV